ncbi:MAG: hypothetical protein RMJ04_01620 [Geminicoccaceae bacterium]|nr:hypothetical protein [Geminicoccaceae bacterium]
MPTLLVLGSKPEPRLPPRETIDALACANASGYSARTLGLPDPEFTVMTAVLTSGKPADEHSLRRLEGLRTRTLYHIRRPKADAGGPLARLLAAIKLRRMTARELRRRLGGLGYRYEELISRPARWYHDLVVRLCAGDPEVAAAIAGKQPSTGLVAVVLGLADGRWDRVVMAGFDFTLVHAYGDNPLIAERGSATSAHAATDVLVLRRLATLRTDLFTTEPVVHARTGVPLCPEVATAGVAA